LEISALLSSHVVMLQGLHKMEGMNVQLRKL
jgi:hypothetical protein